MTMLRATSSIKRIATKALAAKWLTLAAGAAALGLPGMAKADYRGASDYRYRDYGRHEWDRHDDDYHHGGTNIGVDIRIGGAPRPVYREREVRVWVPATYRTVVDRKWVEPVYRTECEQVWVPPVYQDREVHFIGERGRLRCRIERVVVREGYFENRERRVCVSEGHWETCERQELVCAGHYETRIERVPVRPALDPLAIGFGGIWRR